MGLKRVFCMISDSVKENQWESHLSFVILENFARKISTRGLESTHHPPQNHTTSRPRETRWVGHPGRIGGGERVHGAVAGVGGEREQPWEARVIHDHGDGADEATEVRGLGAK